VIGGGGPKKTPALAARFADEYNLPFQSAEANAKAFGRVRAACEDAGRDPGSMVYSAAVVVCCGEDEAEVERRAARIGRQADELRTNGAAGTPEEVLDTIGRYAEAGAQRLYLQVLDVDDLDHVALLANEVRPRA
jgi:alkanesulfonate monooxygenase